MEYITRKDQNWYIQVDLNVAVFGTKRTTYTN